MNCLGSQDLPEEDLEEEDEEDEEEEEEEDEDFGDLSEDRKASRSLVSSSRRGRHTQSPGGGAAEQSADSSPHLSLASLCA